MSNISYFMVFSTWRGEIVLIDFMLSLDILVYVRLWLACSTRDIDFDILSVRCDVFLRECVVGMLR